MGASRPLPMSVVSNLIRGSTCSTPISSVNIFRGQIETDVGADVYDAVRLTQCCVGYWDFPIVDLIRHEDIHS